MATLPHTWELPRGPSHGMECWGKPCRGEDSRSPRMGYRGKDPDEEQKGPPLRLHQAPAPAQLPREPCASSGAPCSLLPPLGPSGPWAQLHPHPPGSPLFSCSLEQNPEFWIDNSGPGFNPGTWGCGSGSALLQAFFSQRVITSQTCPHPPKLVHVPVTVAQAGLTSAL